VGDIGPRGAGVENLKVWQVGDFCLVTWHDFTSHGWGYSPPFLPLSDWIVHAHVPLAHYGLISSLISKPNFKNARLTWGWMPCVIKI
jgi:hypothetical protein